MYKATGKDFHDQRKGYRMKTIAMFLAALMVLLSLAPAATAQETGGLAGGIIGCCFGIRSAAAYNDGKDLHWREWIRLVPLANLVGFVFDIVDGMNGTTTSDLATKYGSNYY